MDKGRGEVATTASEFRGQGFERQAHGWRNLPQVDPELARLPEKYVASPDLVAAVNVALTLGMPLLLTGEPGSGKSQLAHRLAWELGFPPDGKPIRFVVKSTTEARDLFYTFDTVGRFHAAQSAGNVEADASRVAPVNFIEYQALGLAILRAKGRSHLADMNYLNDAHRARLPEEPVRSVVLIDEIDKAPRDVPNDILAEIEDMSFVIAELGRQAVDLQGHEQHLRPVVIITSNSERDLPPAFLRRCVYYHVPFPAFEAQDGNTHSVEAIVHSRLGDRFSGKSAALREALQLFKRIRLKHEAGKLAGKPPGIAELLNWLDHLQREYFAPGARTPLDGFANIPAEALMRGVRLLLLKSKEDQDNAADLIKA